MTTNNATEEITSDSLQQAKEHLSHIKKSSIVELKSFSRPPLVCQLVFEGIGVLFEPTKTKFEWVDAKKLMSGQFLNMLLCFDISKVNKEQLSRLTSVLARDECQIERVKQVSMACAHICRWLHYVAYCANREQQLKPQ